MGYAARRRVALRYVASGALRCGAGRDETGQGGVRPRAAQGQLGALALSSLEGCLAAGSEPAASTARPLRLQGQA